jgi:hypothetical protein
MRRRGVKKVFGNVMWVTAACGASRHRLSTGCYSDAGSTRPIRLYCPSIEAYDETAKGIVTLRQIERNLLKTANT